MSDPVDLATGAGGALGFGGLALALLKWSGQRNVDAIDKQLQALVSSNAEILKELKLQGDKGIRAEEKLEVLEHRVDALETRTDKQATSHREELERRSNTHHERMSQATLMLNQAHGDIVSAIAAVARSEATLTNANASLVKSEGIILQYTSELERIRSRRK